MYILGSKHLHNCSKFITTYYPDTSPVSSIIDHLESFRLQKKDEAKCLSLVILRLRSRLSQYTRLYPVIRYSCNWVLGRSRCIYLFEYGHTCSRWSFWRYINNRRESSAGCLSCELALWRTAVHLSYG